MNVWTITAIFMVSVIIFMPFVILCNPRVREKLRNRNKDDK